MLPTLKGSPGLRTQTPLSAGADAAFVGIRANVLEKMLKTFRSVASLEEETRRCDYCGSALLRCLPVASLPITSQQSSAVLCLATSSDVYSFSGAGAMVAATCV